MIRKVKNWLGIEAVKVELIMPETFAPEDGKISGRLIISSQSEQFVNTLNLTLVERYTRGRRKSKLIDEYTIGELSKIVDKSIIEDQIISEEFTLHFEISKSGMERFGSKNFLYSGLSQLAKLAKNAKSTYFLTVEVDVKGNKLKPYDKVELVAN